MPEMTIPLNTVIQGAMGPAGPIGPPGNTGPAGPPGPRSTQWYRYTGTDIPTGITGMCAGDMCIRNDGEIFIYSDSAWVDAGFSFLMQGS
jgi:hypothetical protein